MQEVKEETKTEKNKESFSVPEWEPKTELGRQVKNGEIRSIDEILKENKVILEAEIVDSLIEVKSELASIGQSKGKFGGGARRAWRQTQKKTEEGSVVTFSALAIVGDENGHIGIGIGKASETLPAREKAMRQAKKNITKIERDCSSFDCNCSEPHTVPRKTVGKSGSVEIELIPAPQGTGLVAGDEVKKVLKLAGIKDVYSKTFGQTKITYNFVKACFNALNNTKPMEEEK
ncbi:MAG: 30S ribosomal protein S5 [Minisyncoccales bacterium]